MRRHLKSCVIGVSCLPFLGMPAFAAGALPNSGNFVSGSGHISANSAATQLTVNQTTKNGIINWAGFSIGAGNDVQINNGNGATLNRVIGNSLSQIDGSLTATGSVYLINQNGIVLTPTGQVVTGGDFVASTRDTANPGFGRGAVHLSGNSSGPINNQGTISAGGSAVLIGYSPINSGTINVPNGLAALVAGDDVTVQPGPGRLQIKVNAGSGDATNSGTIAAAQAMLNAVGGNVYALAGNNNMISATGTANINGHIWLTAGGAVDVEAPVTAQNGDVSITGTGTQAQPTGVTINNLVSGSGSVTVTGTGYAGTTPSTSAYGVAVGPGAAIIAGGSVIVTGVGGNNGAPAQNLIANPVDPCVPGICNYGVVINGGAIESTGTGAVTVTGAGGGTGGASFGNDGVFNAGNIAGNGGDIRISGVGGSTSGADNFGVTNEGYITTAASGKIRITGLSGADGSGAEDPNSIGIGQVGVANLGLIQTGTGKISIFGSVGANAMGAGNAGVGIGGGAILTGGNIDITGMSNGALGSNAGVLLVNFGFGAPVISSANGHIHITGNNVGTDAGGDAGIAIDPGSMVSGVRLLLKSETAPVINFGTLSAGGNGANIIVNAPLFLNYGTVDGELRTGDSED